MERQLEFNKWWLLCKRIRAQTGAKKEAITKKRHLKARMEFVKSILMKLQICGEMVCDQTRQKFKFLVQIQSVTSGESPTLYITQSTPSLLSSMVVTASCHGAAFHQQGLGGLSGSKGQ